MAAAGLIALRDGPGRLAEDHANARRLAEGVAEIVPGAATGPCPDQLVFVDVAGRPSAGMDEAAGAAGLRVTVVPGRVRPPTYADVTARDIETALAAWRRAAAG